MIPLRGIAGCLLIVSARAQDVPSQLEQIVEPSVTGNRFMGAVLVTKDGKPLVDKGYGYANLEWQVPDSPTTKFRLGSLTKQFGLRLLYF